jgi:two-component system, OmpR family, response regulator ChvI
MASQSTPSTIRRPPLQASNLCIIDLMIIDIRMPRINGFDLYRQLKKRDTGVKVCFLTAFQIYYEEFRKMFPAIDVKAFIRKPVTISNLVNQINAVIASK